MINKSLAQELKGKNKREDSNTKTGNESRGVTAGSTETERLREYYRRQYNNQPDDPDTQAKT